MNTRTVMMIVVIGGLGLLGLVVAAMMGVEQLTEKPLIRVSIEVADKHQVKEVSLAIVPPTGASRVLKVSYQTPVIHSSLDAQRDEMEAIAKFAWERVEIMEKGTLRRDERAARGPFSKVAVRRTWKSERGCFKRSDETTHEWTPPPRK